MYVYIYIYTYISHRERGQEGRIEDELESVEQGARHGHVSESDRLAHQESVVQ